ncbi:MAG: hypothetical protein ABIP97_06135 [Chthoniobacterales bacterium]
MPIIQLTSFGTAITEKPMPNWSSTYWRTMLCTIVAFCFISQTAICYADQAGLMPYSHDSAEQHDSSASSSITDDRDCDISDVDVALLAMVEIGRSPVISSHVFMKDDIFAPDGPVREIDRPPGLF